MHIMAKAKLVAVKEIRKSDAILIAQLSLIDIRHQILIETSCKKSMVFYS